VSFGGDSYGTVSSIVISAYAYGRQPIRAKLADEQLSLVDSTNVGNKAT